MHFKHSPSLITLALLCGLAAHTPAQAQVSTQTSPTEDRPAIRFSGFGTLGGVHVQGNGVTFIRDMTQRKGANNRGISFDTDSRLGLQANYNFTDDLEVVAQIVSRYRQENDFRPELTWGFLKYTVNDMLEVRAGRVGFDAYIGSDTRDVGYSYLWVRPPVEYYGALLFPYEDGGDIVVRTPVFNGLARAKLYTGIPRQQTSSMTEQNQWAGHITTPGLGATQDLDKSRVTGGFLEYQDNHWISRIGIARLDITRGFPPGKLGASTAFQDTADDAYAHANPALGQAMTAFLDGIQTSNKQVTFRNIELSYEDGPLKIQGALARMNASALTIPRSRSGFISAGYRIGRFIPYATVSAIRTSEHTQPPLELARLGAPAHVVSMAQFTLRTPRTNQNTYTLGLRHELTNTVALKFQADFIRNKDCSPVSLPVIGPGAPCPPPLLWPSEPVGWNGHANVYSATLDFIF